MIYDIHMNTHELCTNVECFLVYFLAKLNPSKGPIYSMRLLDELQQEDGYGKAYTE